MVGDAPMSWAASIIEAVDPAQRTGEASAASDATYLGSVAALICERRQFSHGVAAN